MSSKKVLVTREQLLKNGVVEHLVDLINENGLELTISDLKIKPHTQEERIYFCIMMRSILKKLR